MWLNLYGSETVQHKPIGLKTPKMHFLPDFELVWSKIEFSLEMGQKLWKQSLI